YSSGIGDFDERLNVLARTGSKRAVDSLLGLPLPSDGDALWLICGTFASLTHYDWCGDESRLADAVLDQSPEHGRKVRALAESLQRDWKRWWARNRASARVFKEGESRPDPLPKLR
ncbi:MAG TPA: hypothetical protein VEA16_08500, partial [Vicinamibacterales bacterium]|nr:hypothetical protein [Vicinamibacterales bacterium]